MLQCPEYFGLARILAFVCLDVAGGSRVRRAASSWQLHHLAMMSLAFTGYFTLRPENHCLHHAHGRQQSNCDGLPHWIIALGAFQTAKNILSIEAGFYSEASLRKADPLIGQEVSTPTSATDEPAWTRRRRWADSAI